MGFVTFQQNVLSPSLADQIYEGKAAFSLIGCSLQFKMRQVGRNDLQVDAFAVIVSATLGQVRYDWAAGNLSKEGYFKAWWRITLPSGKTQDVDEFDIQVVPHALTGGIVERILSEMPSTMAAMLEATTYGIAGVQRAVDTVKYMLYATVIEPHLEATTYGPILNEWASKMAAIRIIPAAADFWANQRSSAQTVREHVQYPDRMSALWEIDRRLRGEMESGFDMWRQEMARRGFDIQFRRKKGLPKVSTVEDLLTPNPKYFGSLDPAVPFGFTGNSNAADRLRSGLSNAWEWGDWA